MKRAILVGLCVAGRVFCQGVVPQPLPNFCVNGSNDKISNVSCVLPNLFYDPSLNTANVVDPTPNARGITLLGAGAAGHTHHFADYTNYSQNLLSLNVSVASQLASLPIPSPASGFVFSYDRTAGVHVPNPRTLGSILTERAETIGAKQVFLGVAYQRFRFTDLDGQNLKIGLPGVFSHESGPAFGAAQQDYVTTRTSMDLKIDQVVFYGTVGITNLFDISVAVPINDVRFGAAATAQINRIPDPVTGSINLCVNGTSPCHFFEGGPVVTSKSYANSATATGVGDVNIRFKQSLRPASAGKQGWSLALLTDLRLPTGDERNFLGSGAYGIRPFLALSLGSTAFAPHFNAGYQINGSSILAGDVTRDIKGHLPNLFFYSAGTDIGIVKDRLTVAADYMGQYFNNGPQIFNDPFAGLNGAAVSRVGLRYAGYATSSASVGFKLAIFKHLLFTGNVLVRLDNNGLRQRATPLIGLSSSL